MSEYWKRVAGRLFSLGRVAVNAAIPKVLEASLNSAYKLVEKKLHQIYKKTIRNAAITLAINVTGMLILIFHPFGKQITTLISMAFFAGAFIFWLVRVILYCKNYGLVTVAITRNVFKERSLSKGISCFVKDKYPLITWTYAGIDIAATQFSALKEIPRLEELVKLFIQNFWKRIALFAGLMAFYTITVYWILKPIMLFYIGSK